MKYLRYILWFVCILNLLGQLVLCSKPVKLKIGFITVEDMKSQSAEEDSALEWLKQSGFDYRIVSFQDIAENKYLDEVDVLWWHDASSIHLPEIAHDSRVTAALKEFVHSGKGLLLSLAAAQYPVTLGIETNPPNRIEKGKWKIKDPYKEIKGFHSYDGHPIFNGLFGGVFVWNTKANYEYVTVFYDSTLPVSGKVVGIGWDYLTLNENERHVIEYNYGAGKVLTIGSFLYFNDSENVYRPHLEKFMSNCLSYLGKNKNEDASTYWRFQTPEFVAFESVTSRLLKIPARVKPFAPVPSSGLEMKKEKGSDNFFAVSGLRALIMGKEKGGLDEVWIHPYRILQNLRTGLKIGNTTHWLDELEPEIRVRPESFTRKYDTGKGRVTETIFAARNAPGGVIHVESTIEADHDLIFQFEVDNRVMWPFESNYLGNTFYSFDENLKAVTIKTDHASYFSLFGADQIPTRHNFKIIEKGGIKKLQVHLQYALPKNQNPRGLNFVFVGTSTGRDRAEKSYVRIMQDIPRVYRENVDYYSNLLNSKTIIQSPDEEFNAGYKWALTGVDRFFVQALGVGSSFMAGFGTTARGWDGNQKVNGRPGYAWYFGRDAEWTCFAVNAYGDFEKVKATLKFLGAYQDITGKILHELTSSGAVHYDAADSTPLYLILMGRYVRATGDQLFLQQEWPHIKKAMDFCYSTDTDGDNLIENTNVGHGWIEGGKLYGAHVTFYLAGAWAAALKEMAFMANLMGKPELKNKYELDYNKVEKILNHDFWNEEAQFYHYGKLKDGRFNPEKTILPAVPITFSVTDPHKSRKVVQAFAGNDFTTNWGARILGASNPLFNPRGYHYGSVWPLFSGWAALAEFKTGSALKGFSHVMNNVLIQKSWGLGYIEEVLDGMVYKPAGVCAHQAWSESMVLQPLLEGMLGIKPNAVKNKLALSPWFPAQWDWAEVKNIHVGKHAVDLKMQRTANGTTYTFYKSTKEPLKINFAPVLAPGTRVKKVILDGQEMPYSFIESKLFLSFDLSATVNLDVETSGGVEVSPIIPHPRPGERPYGFRVIHASFAGQTYRLQLEGVPGVEYLLNLYTPWKIEKIENGELDDENRKQKIIKVRFAEADKKYISKDVKIFFENK